MIGGHLDSINGSSPRTGRAPGADDNASGIAVVTESLAALIASGYRPEKTIKFMGYAAEEVGLRGSAAIAEDFQSRNVNVLGVLQFDMTSYTGQAGLDVVLTTDYVSSTQNDFLAQLMDTYLPELNYDYENCGYACSDHASWDRAGFQRLSLLSQGIVMTTIIFIPLPTKTLMLSMRLTSLSLLSHFLLNSLKVAK